MKRKLIELPTDLFNKIEVLAKQNDRSVNKQILVMLKEVAK